MSDLEDDTDWLYLGDDTITDGSFLPNNLASDVFIFHNGTEEIPLIDISQNALIKFIRNAPITLRWFRRNSTTQKLRCYSANVLILNLLHK